MEKYQVLLYYNYVYMDDPVRFSKEHLSLCNKLGLKGRILVAEEGINGTVSGTIEATNAYIVAMHNDSRFAEMPFKIDSAEGHTFKKMHVRPRSELVTLRLDDDINPLETTGNYLTPADFYLAMQEDDTIVIDARNDYEYDLGHFRGAIRPDIHSFRELPEWIEQNRADFEDKKILTYCTGGIRCEKFSGWLVNQGFENVNQLHGGIATYSKDPATQGQMWDGRMYVFDERLSVPINKVEHVIVGKDYFDGEPCERYVNCANPVCNKQIICSEENEHKYLRGCTSACRTTERNLYVKEQNLTPEEIKLRLNKLELKNSNAVS